ncbi:hypothetical protein BGX34_012066 [Mortierella sp. NVP85]|nr:hypothetical protein BGX34_012066 [Mortierella sp. NVP85]
MNDQKKQLHPLDLDSSTDLSSPPPSSPHPLSPLSPASVTSNVTFHDSVRDNSKGQASAALYNGRLRNRMGGGPQIATVLSEGTPFPPSGGMASASTSMGCRTPGGIGRRLSGQGGRYLPEEGEEEPKPHPVLHFLKELYDKCSPSLILENKGSIARDHLANERTFLAWLRSSLSMITVGVAITQLFRLQSGSTGGSVDKVTELGRPLGGSFVALGILFLWLGASRYFHSQNVLSYGQFPASRGSVILATVTVMSVLLACFIIVIVQGRTSS